MLVGLSLEFNFLRVVGSGGHAYYSVEMSAPAKAKSQSCFAQVLGDVRPSLRPHFVRYSTQLGPPSAVAV